MLRRVGGVSWVNLNCRLNAILWQKTPSLNKSKGMLRKMTLHKYNSVCHCGYHFGDLTAFIFTERRSSSSTAAWRDPTHLVVPFVRTHFIRLKKQLYRSKLLFQTLPAYSSCECAHTLWTYAWRRFEIKNNVPSANPTKAIPPQKMRIFKWVYWSIEGQLMRAMVI